MCEVTVNLEFPASRASIGHVRALSSVFSTGMLDKYLRCFHCGSVMSMIERRSILQEPSLGENACDDEVPGI